MARLNRPTLNAVCSVDVVEFRPKELLLNELGLLCCSSNDFGLTSLDLAARSILRNTSRGMECLFIGVFFLLERICTITLISMQNYSTVSVAFSKIITSPTK